MISIKNLLNKIKWDSREKPEEYSLYYLDRVENELVVIKFRDIKRIEDNFIVIDRDINGKQEETMIPLHRIRKVMKKDIIVWER